MGRRDFQLLTFHALEQRVDGFVLAQGDVDVLDVRGCSAAISGDNFGYVCQNVPSVCQIEKERPCGERRRKRKETRGTKHVLANVSEWAKTRCK